MSVAGYLTGSANVCMSAGLHIFHAGIIIRVRNTSTVRVRYMYDGRGPCAMPKPGGALPIKLSKVHVAIYYHKSFNFN